MLYLERARRNDVLFRVYEKVVEKETPKMAYRQPHI